MPPKPRIRLARKPPTASKPRSAPPIAIQTAKPLPQATSRLQPSLRPSPPTQTTPPPPPRWSQSTRFLTWGANGVVIICIMLHIRDYWFELQHVRGSSMAPTLSPSAHETGQEDYVIVRAYRERVAARGKSGEDFSWGVKRGDVVTFWKPHKPGEMGIKRVVAMQGDTVYPSRGYALDAEVRASRLAGMPDGLGDGEDGVFGGGQELGKVVVPYGHVWVEGDNWRQSLDSNDFGPISMGLIQGKAVWVWRNWCRLQEVGDGRDKSRNGEMGRTRVVEGRSEIPTVFLE
ncbi:LexA/Signal peptidase [Decorospora gaudefroyi]|uniref:Mitochondrial inner membrane protease subunit n=1 Tax=Decorospora gaudefroyi TaxID=184978 RepID=A0A6A5KYP7_9PLEO|nr:LexA/Signal peptidase [Decorospora gaudefroyi]